MDAPWVQGSHGISTIIAAMQIQGGLGQRVLPFVLNSSVLKQQHVWPTTNAAGVGCAGSYLTGLFSMKIANDCSATRFQENCSVLNFFQGS